jgi:transcriptional regulator with XRE-family HTH domain
MNDRANQERFAARVAALRDELGLSLDDVGAAVGVSGETIRNWERCRFVPRKKVTVTKLEQALEARTGELWAPQGVRDPGQTAVEGRRQRTSRRGDPPRVDGAAGSDRRD